MHSYFFIDALQDTIQTSQQDDLLRTALAQGADLKDYSKSIDQDLSKIEWDAIGDCIFSNMSFL